MAEKKMTDVSKHILVPVHEKMTENEKKLILERYSITEDELGRISASDPALAGLKANPGDVIRIIRDSPTAGKVKFYRCVTNG